MTAQWLFRVASHPSYGGGHVARSGVLAGELARYAPVCMVLDWDSGDARCQLQARGLSCVTIDHEMAGPWTGAVVDGYALRDVEVARIAAQVRPLVWIDDFLDPPEYADLLINSACHLSGNQIKGVPALLGPRFALIDPRYAAQPERDRTRPVDRVLVTFGRIDPGNATGLVLKALAPIIDLPPTTVVVDPASPHFSSISAQVTALGVHARLVPGVADMRPLIAEADLVIGAGGVSLLERMVAGVPSVTLRIADNQALLVEGAARAGATLDVGNASGIPSEMLTRLITELLWDSGRRAAMARAARRMIDGQGAHRVASALVSFAERWHQKSSAPAS